MTQLLSLIFHSALLFVLFFAILLSLFLKHYFGYSYFESGIYLEITSLLYKGGGKICVYLILPSPHFRDHTAFVVIGLIRVSMKPSHTQHTLRYI